MRIRATVAALLLALGYSVTARAQNELLTQYQSGAAVSVSRVDGSDIDSYSAANFSVGIYDVFQAGIEVPLDVDSAENVYTLGLHIPTPRKQYTAGAGAEAIIGDLSGFGLSIYGRLETSPGLIIIPKFTFSFLSEDIGPDQTHEVSGIEFSTQFCVKMSRQMWLSVAPRASNLSGQSESTWTAGLRAGLTIVLDHLHSN